MAVKIDNPRIEQGDAMLIAGLADRIEYSNAGSIPNLWQRFAPYIGSVPNAAPGPAYGVKFNSDERGFEYLAGVEVSATDGLPKEFRTIHIPACTYAVFTHRGHISTIRETMSAIWNDYLPKSGLKPADTPEFESYGRLFDPATGNGEVDVFIPIET